MNLREYEWNQQIWTCENFLQRPFVFEKGEQKIIVFDQMDHNICAD
jgi:hypothetical protein